MASHRGQGDDDHFMSMTRMTSIPGVTATGIWRAWLQSSSFTGNPGSLFSVPGAPDDLVLKIFSQVVEIVAVPRHANYQVTVQFRMFLCLPQCLCTYNIELDMVSVEAEVAPYKSSEFTVALLIFEELRGELLVEKCASRFQVINL